MICKVVETIEKYHQLKDVRTVLVGVSGGADSMCLLDILIKLKLRYGIVIKAVHVNHNLRGAEALRDENVVRDYCKKMGVELTVFSENIRELSEKLGIGEEECGRNIRYERFAEMNTDAVATAHTLSDSIETMLFNLSRGTGMKGLCAIPPKREPNIIRPLIECTRAETEKYCEDNLIEYITDSSNLSDEYSRNYIRHNVVPLFSSLNSGFEKNFARCFSTLYEENDYLDFSAKALIEKAEINNGYSVKIIKNTHPAVRKRAIGMIISNYLNKPVESRHIEIVDKAILNEQGKIELSKDLYISINSDIITFQSYEINIEPWVGKISEGTATTPYGNYILEKVTSDECKSLFNCFDGDKIKGQLIIRSRRQGDNFSDIKRKNTKSLKKLFNEKKVPVGEREKLAVLCDDENVIYVENIGIDRKYFVDSTTKKILRIKKEGT